MSVVPDFDWYMLGIVLEWGKVLGAGYLGWRAIRAYERRPLGPMARTREKRRQRPLARRLRQLEATMRQVEAQSAQALEAQRFTTAVLTRAPAERDVRASRAGLGS